MHDREFPPSPPTKYVTGAGKGSFNNEAPDIPEEAAHVGAWGETIAGILLEIGGKTSDEDTALTLARLAGKIRAQSNSVPEEAREEPKKGDAQPKHTELIQRIGEAVSRISKMCSEGRPPKMSIPVRPEDDDIFISETLVECRDVLRCHDVHPGPWRVSGAGTVWSVEERNEQQTLRIVSNLHTSEEAIAVRDALNGVNRLEGDPK